MVLSVIATATNECMYVTLRKDCWNLVRRLMHGALANRDRARYFNDARNVGRSYVSDIAKRATSRRTH